MRFLNLTLLCLIFPACSTSAPRLAEPLSETPATPMNPNLQSPPGLPDKKMGCETSQGEVSHGEAILGYLEAVAPPGEECRQVSAICSDGILTGPFLHPSCIESPPLEN